MLLNLCFHTCVFCTCDETTLNDYFNLNPYDTAAETQLIARFKDAPGGGGEPTLTTVHVPLVHADTFTAGRCKLNPGRTRLTGLTAW